MSWWVSEVTLADLATDQKAKMTPRNGPKGALGVISERVKGLLLHSLPYVHGARSASVNEVNICAQRLYQLVLHALDDLNKPQEAKICTIEILGSWWEYTTPKIMFLYEVI